MQFTAKILVLGDLMLDNFIYGKVDRISPEAPVPVVDVYNESHMLGGCGNVTQNLYNLGVSTMVLSAVGNDENGNKILDKLSKMKIETSTVYRSNTMSTNYKMRVVANNQHVVRVDWDSIELDKNIETSISSVVLELIEKVDGIIISDYGKGVCSENILKNIFIAMRDNKKPIFVDPKGSDWRKYSGATFITPNIREISSIIGFVLQSDNDFINAGMKVLNQFGIENCLITRGADGMTLVSKNETFHVPAQSREVYDVSGAGDTVVACLAVATILGKSKKESVEFANKAAGIVVSHLGTSAITLNELGIK
jgi:D-beta-D-heptose 7-phosphate kinase/D-beta-D-heptose 1-phosphate adenosyltransferase